MKGRYRRACGLEYLDAQSNAPRVCAQADEVEADMLVKIARRYNIPVVERSDLAQALASLELDQEVPPELYQAIAIVFHELEKRILG